MPSRPFPRRRWIVGAILAGLLASCTPLPTVAAEQDAKLEALFREYLEAAFQQRPMSATQLGDHRFDHLLDDLSPEAQARWLQLDRATLGRLAREIDYQQLSRAAQIDFEILRQELTRSLWAAEHVRRLERDPRAYNEYLTDSVFLLLSQSTLPKERNVANAIARMRQIPAVVAAAKRNLNDSPGVVTRTAINQNRGAVAFYEREVFELVGPTPQERPLREAAQAATACLKDYQTFLEKDLLPRAKGAWRLGKERFAEKLAMELDAGMTADEVLAAAESEFARVERDMYVLARQLWGQYFPRRSLPPDDAEGRHGTIAEVLGRIAQDHGRAEDLYRDAKATVARIKEFIAARGILPLPDPDRCSVIEMPEFQRGNSTAYLNPAPPLDPKAGSMYAVSPPPKDWDAAKVKSLLEEYNRHMLQILTIHEAYPGHYVQLEYANRQPSLVRRVLGSGVYIEGWAVYTEQMMLDQGYGDGNLPLRLTQLKFYLRAVTNAILDHKMHCTEMSDDEALALLVQRAFQAEGEARLKVVRSKQSACQLSTYFIGRTAMCRLRQQIQRELGDRFDLGRYHQAVLDQGSVPVKYLPELIRASDWYLAK